AEADPQAFARAVGAHDDLVAVLEEGPLLPRRQRGALRAAPRELEQAAARRLRLARDRAAGEQIAWTQVAAVRGVVRDDLAERPVHVAKVAAAEADRLDVALAHLRGREEHIDDDVERAGSRL